MTGKFTNRKNPRLSCYDYTSCGAYFVTICTYDRRKTLGEICRDDPCGRPKTALLPLGKIASDTLQIIEEKYNISVDYFVIMPDHIHIILFLPDTSPAEHGYALGRIIGAYKSLVANEWLKICKADGVTMGKLWQERYYDHIIRNDEDLANVRAYIAANPDRWAEKYMAE